MYQVITMYGDNEPWWFFEEWQTDVQETKNFADFDEAVLFYEDRWSELQKTNTYSNAKHNYLSAFWNDQDERWCEECDDYLQQYWGLALLKDGQPVTVDDSRKEFYEAANYSGKAKCCKRLEQGA
ncbi:DUF1033 family protein [Enterococcus pseudoavium]|uniref:DUF1033 family protein n=1 Tax=Enterococcus pseudoavium TaxID=44007 RepID=A0ABU3FH46_9ENTE|nr:DUF1033 family protein [Enterococcus pseudoavium]MDT2770343.1 DUF1033 family protein [Enterococcus pseudoavium]